MSVSLAECCLADKCNGYDTRFFAFSKIGYVFYMGRPPHFFAGYWESVRKLGPNLYAKF